MMVTVVYSVAGLAGLSVIISFLCQKAVLTICQTFNRCAASAISKRRDPRTAAVLHKIKKSGGYTLKKCLDMNSSLPLQCVNIKN